PLAISRAELESICIAYQEQVRRGRSPFLMVGFNRRFSLATHKLKEFFAGRREPMSLQIRINAGYLPKEHWSQLESSGGRLVGEACHFVDWARAVVGRGIRSVFAQGLPNGARYNRDNVLLTLVFDDGSIANISYLANGDRSLNKELYEVFCEGAVARID